MNFDFGEKPTGGGAVCSNCDCDYGEQLIHRNMFVFLA